MFDYANFSKSIKFYRQKLGYSQEELAEKIGIGYKHLSNIERGLAKPSVSTVIKILNVFHISLAECLSGYSKDEINLKKLKIKEILSCIDLIKPDKKEKNFLLAIVNIINNKEELKNGNQ